MYDLDDLQHDELIDSVEEGVDPITGEITDLLQLNLPDESEDSDSDLDDDENDNPFFTSNDDDDDDEQDEDEDEEESENNIDKQDEESITESSAINELLKLKGIENPKAVKFEDENGEVVELDFYDLPYEEQLEILKSSDTDINFGLNDSEINTINFLRHNEVTLEDVIEYYKRKAIEDYIKENTTVTFKVDDYNDEELFLLDLKSKYDTLTEEELQLELDKEQNHPDLFKKKIDRIRDEYLRLEELERKEQEDSKLEQENEKFETLKNDLISVATDVEEIGGIDLEIDDKNSVLEFILVKDVNGKSSLDKIMSEPNKLFELAWYASKGQEAFDFIHTYYKKEIETVRKTAYAKAKDELSKAPQQKIVTRKNSIKKVATRPQNNVLSIEDIHD